jgi:hypothetical protein
LLLQIQNRRQVPSDPSHLQNYLPTPLLFRCSSTLALRYLRMS